MSASSFEWPVAEAFRWGSPPALPRLDGSAFDDLSIDEHICELDRIAARGLGEDVPEALQYASVGQGIIAGFAILFCAMILDRIDQDARK